MFRIAAMLAGLVLIALPAWFLSGSIPVPQYRKGGLTDYLPMLRQGLAIYGSVLLGVAIYLMRIRLSGQPAFPLELFKAGMYGVLACCIIFFGGGRLYSLAKYGAFDKAIGGNLWGLLVIFWGFFGAFVSAGLALLLYASTGPGGYAGPGPGSGRNCNAFVSR
jgi:hypothetical protein